MKKTDEITYLFGAGASYYSMPLVENFGSRFEVFIKFLEDYISVSKIGFLNDCKVFKNEVSNHLSFDTFFKKLFHLSDVSAEKYKAILLIFFLYEQLQDISTVDIFIDPEKYGKKYGIKKGNIDPRYDALIAGILQPQKGKFSPIAKINFLTWNYDTSLVASIKNFKSLNSSLVDFVKLYESSINHFEIDSDLQVIHLNGRVFHPLFSKYEQCDQHRLIVELTALIIEYDIIDSKIWSHSNQIKFSWETISETNLDFGIPIHIAKAIDAIKRSTIVIVIGYSFPLYNRLIDTAVLNQANLSGKTVYIQDPHSKELKSILENDFGLFVGPTSSITVGNKTSVVIKHIENCNSFFVPSDIYVSPLINANPG